MLHQTLKLKISFQLGWLACSLLLASCVSVPRLSAATSAEQTKKLYWRSVGKPDGRYYIVPRPELSSEFPTPDAINNLTYEQAKAVADRLNASLQFNVTSNTENGNFIIRITPEPHIEDIVAICRQHPRENVIQNRCLKELKWAASNARPDIYLRHTACEAVFFATQLNVMYQTPQPSFSQCAP